MKYRPNYRAKRRHDAFKVSLAMQAPFASDRDRSRAVARARAAADEADDLFAGIDIAMTEAALFARDRLSKAGVPDHVAEDIADAVHAATAETLRRAGA